MEEKHHLIEYLLIGVFAVLASFAGSLDKMQRAQLTQNPYNHAAFWVGLFLSMFTGLFFVWIAQIWFDSFHIVGLFGAVGGFLGIEFLKKAAEAFGDIIIAIIGKKGL
tara:strand:+ start:199 stop:522 length:324 start_codon:yes stop_codon:yes gene_type:complete